MKNDSMTSTSSAESPALTLTPHDIIAWLKDNPCFLEQHPEALEILAPPKAHNGKGVADFQSYLVRRLKADKQEILEQSRELVETARSNMNNQARVHRAVLRLLEANSFEDFVRTITLDLSTLLDVDISVLVAESNGRDIPHVHTSGVRVVPAGTIDNWMRGKDILLQDDISGIEAIYGGGAGLVRSQALVRVDISMNTPPALLAFGSRGPDTFTDGQGTEQVAFLARVVERQFRSWLALPA